MKAIKIEKNGQVKIVAVKEFQERQSLLTDLIKENSSILSLHNLILTTVGYFVLSSLVEYFHNQEKFHGDLDNFIWNMKYFQHFVVADIIMHAVMVGLLYPLVLLRSYYQFRKLKSLSISELELESKNPDQQQEDNIAEELSQENRERIKNQIQFGSVESLAFTVGYLTISLFGLLFFSVWFIIHLQIKIIGSFSIMMEMIRLTMKAHSYFIENQYQQQTIKDKILEKIQNTNVDSFWKAWKYPKLSNYLFYLMAPTLIYRDSYPRNEKIRWGFLISCIVEFLTTLYIVNLLSCRFLIDKYSSTIGIEPIRFRELHQHLAWLAFYGFLSFLLMFYGFFHLWHNITAELLRFADRNFYEAWWESVNIEDFLRKWNLIVQEWLFVYVFVPVQNRWKKRWLATNFVLMLSAIIHELILAVSFKFLIPLIFFEFITHGHLNQTLIRNIHRKKTLNIIFFAEMIFGWSLLIAIPCVEWYSRVNCPSKDHLSSLLFHLVTIKNSIKNHGNSI